MDAWVPKTGVEMFDALHASGLAVLLATASEKPVTLHDRGLAYGLSADLDGSDLHPPLEILDQILQLPTEEEIASLAQMRHPLPLSFTNLDGLLAAVYTQKGIRLASLAELEQKQHWSPAAGGLGLQKVQQTITRLKSWAGRRAQADAAWLQYLLADYHVDSAPDPLISPTHKGRDLSVWMTLDPSVAQSTRQPLSDGVIAMKSNLTMRSPQYGVFLSVIGAARFLRAQPVADQLINYYLPLATTLTLTAETTLPPLPVLKHPHSQALLASWLAYVRKPPPLEATWQALAYQALSNGGTRQPLSLTRGALSFAWIVNVAEHTDPGMIRFWRSLLKYRPEQAPYEIHRLCGALLHRDSTSWLMHVRDHAHAIARFPDGLRPYTCAELQEVNQIMTAPSVPLRTILERKQGTLRFGRSLRLLGQVNHAKLVDLLDLLEQAQTQEQLLSILKKTAQACELASAKTPFIIVPDEKDFGYLLEDVDVHGVSLIASMLQILSALRYPSSDSEPGVRNGQLQDEVSAASSASTIEGAMTHGK